jgi:hypothetical protein
VGRPVEASIEAKYSELRHTGPEIQRVLRQSNPRQSGLRDHLADSIPVLPGTKPRQFSQAGPQIRRQQGPGPILFNQAYYPYLPPIRLRDRLVRLQGTWSAAEASTATTSPAGRFMENVLPLMSLFGQPASFISPAGTIPRQSARTVGDHGGGRDAFPASRPFDFIQIKLSGRRGKETREPAPLASSINHEKDVTKVVSPTPMWFP